MADGNSVEWPPNPCDALDYCYYYCSDLAAKKAGNVLDASVECECATTQPRREQKPSDRFTHYSTLAHSHCLSGSSLDMAAGTVRACVCAGTHERPSAWPDYIPLARPTVELAGLCAAAASSKSIIRVSDYITSLTLDRSRQVTSLYTHQNPWIGATQRLA